MPKSTPYIVVSIPSVQKNPQLLLVKGFKSGPTWLGTMDPPDYESGALYS